MEVSIRSTLCQNQGLMTILSLLNAAFNDITTMQTLLDRALNAARCGLWWCSLGGGGGGILGQASNVRGPLAVDEIGSGEWCWRSSHFW